MASQPESGLRIVQQNQALRPSQGRVMARDPPRGWQAGGQDDFDTSTGRHAEFVPQRRFAHPEANSAVKNFRRKIFLVFQCTGRKVYVRAESSFTM